MVSPRTSQHTGSPQSDPDYRYGHAGCVEWLAYAARTRNARYTVCRVNVVVAMATQYCSPAPCLGQPINGATHAAGNREMGLNVSHDQYCYIVDCFSLLTAAVLAVRSWQCSTMDHPIEGHNIIAEPPLAMLFLDVSNLHKTIAWRSFRPIGSVLSIFGMFGGRCFGSPTTDFSLSCCFPFVSFCSVFYKVDDAL